MSGTRLFLSTFGLLFLVKVKALFRARALGEPLPSGLGLFLFLFAWPGVRPESFLHGNRRPLPDGAGRDFLLGFASFALGAAAMAGLALYWPELPRGPRSFAGLGSFFLLLHFGLAPMGFACFRLAGWPVERLFRAPWRSRSLRDFWSNRWNLAFVDMNRRLIRPHFPRALSGAAAALGIFVVSGLLHEIAISFPAGGGWGGPLLYFLLQGVLVVLEPKLRVRGPLWTLSAVLVPLPLLFPRPFLDTFVDPVFAFLSARAEAMSLPGVLESLLWACGLGHLLVLGASFQVPARLHWKEELPRLGRFNRKLFWTYGGYIVFCIVSFGLVDLLQPAVLLQPSGPSRAILLFIALFWSGRILVDTFWFEHRDWPPGDLFLVGHTCLTALFVTLAAVHWGALAWQLTAR